MALSIKVKSKRKSIHIPRSMDEKYMGTEPRFDPNVVVDSESMAEAYNWYNYFYDYPDSRKFLVSYLKENKYDKDVIEHVSNLPVTFHPPTVGWIARILSRGAKINDISKTWFKFNLEKIINHNYSPLDSGKKKNTIQDRMNAQYDRCVSDIEEQLDLFFADKIDSFDIKEYIKDHNVNGIVSKRVSSHYERLLKEYDDVLDRKDDQLKEAYSSISKAKLKNMREFLNQIMSGLKEETHIAKTLRKSRKPRVKSTSQQVSKLKYMSQYKDLGLISVSPESIVGSSQLWIYNTKTRKLGVYNAEGISGLKVKGSTIIAFDSKTSISKKLRKPEVTIPTVTQGGKVTLRTVLDNVKAVASELNGRINKDTILLRTVK